MSAPYLSFADYLASMGSRLILAQDGGGMQGLVSLGFLLEIKGFLRARHGGDPNFCLCDYFELIPGTSGGVDYCRLYCTSSFCCSDCLAPR